MSVLRARGNIFGVASEFLLMAFNMPSAQGMRCCHATRLFLCQRYFAVGNVFAARVIQDGNLTTARWPGDAKVFAEAFLNQVAQRGQQHISDASEKD